MARRGTAVAAPAEGGAELRLVDVADERNPLARSALSLISEALDRYDVHPRDFFLAELEETRRGFPAGGDYHLLALVDTEDRPVSAVAGVYLAGVNAGFVTYLATRPELRGQELGRRIRVHLKDALRAEARRRHGLELAHLIGEVRRGSPWLRALVRRGQAIPFDIHYVHPWMSQSAANPYVLYREPVGDPRLELPATEVARLLYAIYRRAYRIDFPVQTPNFRFLLGQLDSREVVGIHPEFAGER